MLLYYYEMKELSLKTIFSSVFLVLGLCGYSQKHFTNYVQAEVGLAISISDVKRYDFAPTTQTQSEIQPGSSAEITFFTNENIGINIDFQRYWLAGVNPDLNLKFTGSAWSPSLNLTFAFNQMFEDGLRSPWNRRFKLIGKIGYGRVMSSANLEKINPDTTMTPLGADFTLGNKSVSVGSIPLKLTLMFKLNKTHNQFYRRGKDRLFLVVSGKVQFVGTDELDNYIDAGFSNDALTCFSVGMAYFFGN